MSSKALSLFAWLVYKAALISIGSNESRAVLFPLMKSECFFFFIIQAHRAEYK